MACSAATEDRTPPIIVSRKPLPNAKQIRVSAPIEVVFSEPMKVLDAMAPVGLTDPAGESVLGSFQFSQDRKTLTIVQKSNTNPSTKMTLSLSPMLTDDAGNVLTTTESWSWEQPAWLDVSSTGVFDGADHMVIDSTGYPIITSPQAIDQYNAGVVVKRWNGTSWSSLGDLLNLVNTQPGIAQSIKLLSNNNPVVLWSEIPVNTGNNNLHVKVWTGTQWKSLDGAIETIANISASLMELDPDGNPTVAWSEGFPIVPGGFQIYVKRWDGVKWVALGSSLNVGATSSYAAVSSLALDATGKPTVLWTERDQNGNDIPHIKRWTGTEWESLDALLVVPKSARLEILKIGTDRLPMIAWISDGTTFRPTELSIRKWNGSEWQVIAGGVLPFSADTNTFVESIRLLPDGNPIIAFSEDTLNSRDLSILRWQSSRWEKIGATPVNVQTGSGAVFPVIASNTSGDVFVVWRESTSLSLGKGVPHFLTLNR
jgi:Bacterial Ig-like domain